MAASTGPVTNALPVKKAFLTRHGASMTPDMLSGRYWESCTFKKTLPNSNEVVGETILVQACLLEVTHFYSVESQCDCQIKLHFDSGILLVLAKS